MYRLYRERERKAEYSDHVRFELSQLLYSLVFINPMLISHKQMHVNVTRKATDHVLMDGTLCPLVSHTNPRRTLYNPMKLPRILFAALHDPSTSPHSLPAILDGHRVLYVHIKYVHVYVQKYMHCTLSLLKSLWRIRVLQLLPEPLTVALTVLPLITMAPSAGAAQQGSLASSKGWDQLKRPALRPPCT